MTQNLGGWIHSFTVTDTLTHKQGYTIYKITSIVFPRSVPEALTCISVWKRFHDIKRLYREISRRHKTMNLNGQVPEPSDNSFFKRFDAKVIQNRKEYILNLLDFVAQHPALYKSHAFMHFFNDGHSADNSSQFHHDLSSKGNIEAICDNLDIQYDDSLSLVDPKKDQTIVQSFENKLVKPSQESEMLEDVKKDESPKKPKEAVRDFSKILTPMVSFEGEDNDYIYEAALQFSRAVQAEVNMEYAEAYKGYKQGVDVLLSGAKDDCNEERKLIAKTKVNKYMARAEDLFDKFLVNQEDDNKNNFQLSIDMTDTSNSTSSSLYLERPWNHLVKYKVLRIIDTVMLVQNVTDKTVFIMKGIEKPSSNSPAQTVFLPQNVPYMVNLMAFFQSEQKIFFLLQQAKGGKLFDYVKSYSPTCEKTASLSEIFTEVDPEKNRKCISIENLAKSNTHDSGFAETPDIPTENMDFADIVMCSQKLIESVSNTLKKVENKKEELLTVEAVNSLPLTPSRFLKSPKKKLSLPEASVKQWARELITAVNVLHSKGVILGDLHGGNLLLGSKGQLLLSYFYQNEGISDGVQKVCSYKALSEHYVAPERPLTTKSDWWSCGVALFQLLLGVSFKQCHPGNMDLYSSIQYPHVEISEEAVDLLEGLLQLTPALRFDFDQICAHSFFKGTNWEELAQNGTNSI
ncbi:ribosomal protein S6 kinase delta-1 [Episyrphus balteatus]|uniref:ribosomal protein S6 kinase delta-1 n=1 Tax=Episyrphus balteatus TaxID=286459 RepID=UPI002484E853|nr:ribosomal protein S6 kinase delta-1 [Episyrphus balteatus]